MSRPTTLALAIALALAAAGCTSSVSTRYVSEKSLGQERLLPLLDASGKKDKNGGQSEARSLFCLPYPFPPWCI